MGRRPAPNENQQESRTKGKKETRRLVELVTGLATQVEQLVVCIGENEEQEGARVELVPICT